MNGFFIFVWQYFFQNEDKENKIGILKVKKIKKY